MGMQICSSNVYSLLRNRFLASFGFATIPAAAKEGAEMFRGLLGVLFPEEQFR